jgi:SSS family solute:Na+ symporter
MTRRAALGGMIVGAVTVLIWIYLPVEIGGQRLSAWMYEIVPGFILSSLTIMVLSKSGSPREGVTETFDAFQAQLNQK